ncbi:MAG: cobalt ECF transporter T component CbiQ [Candidatus Omnitrophica bacterium]|nr:cobalt ECF transporter T component CbiQ [Candidatus Omnitrophota bacterium]
MNNIGKNSFDIGYLDTLAAGDSSLHHLDPRAKLITTCAFIITVVSFDKYALAVLIPFFIYPVALISIGGLPAEYLLKKAFLVCPFAVLVGIFNPLVDREIIFHIGAIGIPGGWVSFLSILLRFVLTVTAALILVSLTGFNRVCEALLQLGVPKAFVVQLLFFYRYIFVLTDEAERMVRARSLRAFNASAMGLRNFISLAGHLLLRTLDRAERIYRAMCCRGFDGHIRIIRSSKIRCQEVVFASAWLFVFVLLRFFNVSLKIGDVIMGLFQ